MYLNIFKLDNYSTVEGDEGCRVGKVRASATSPVPDHKGFKLQYLSEIHSLHFEVNFQKSSTLRVKCMLNVYAIHMYEIFNCSAKFERAQLVEANVQLLP